MGYILPDLPPAWADRPGKAWRAACRSYALIWGVLGRTVVEMCGETGLQAVAEAFRRIARLQAGRAFETGQFERNARGMAAYMQRAEETLGMWVEIEEGATPRRAVFRWRRCPLYDDPARESTPELCLAYDQFEVEAARLCHPRLQCTITKSMGRGDDCCEMVFEMAGEGPEEG
ncbi:MAG: L-2-amino-thiazoline-4-carboxylic acid hydrolase [Chloroflexia bacterium]